MKREDFIDMIISGLGGEKYLDNYGAESESEAEYIDRLINEVERETRDDLN